MTTCPKCGIESQSIAYHACQLTEARVREIAREEIRLREAEIEAARKWNVFTPNVPLLEHEKHRAREEALEEAAVYFETPSDGWAAWPLSAERLRKLKSQSAKSNKLSDFKDAGPEIMEIERLRSDLARVGRRADMLDKLRVEAIGERDFLRKQLDATENDEAALRSRLDAALDVLRWYADEKNHCLTPNARGEANVNPSVIWYDQGKRAREFVKDSRGGSAVER